MTYVYMHKCKYKIARVLLLCIKKTRNCARYGFVYKSRDEFVQEKIRVKILQIEIKRAEQQNKKAQTIDKQQLRLLKFVVPLGLE